MTRGYSLISLKNNPKAISKRLLRLLFVGFMMALTSCQLAADSQPETTLNGRILVWHSWGDPGSAVMEELIANYQSVHRNVTIVAIYVEPNELQERYMRTAALGLGPDLMIGPSSWLGPLIEQNSIAPIDLSFLELIKFNSAAIQLATRNKKLYGIPIALKTPVLYTNKTITDDVKTTYEELLNAAINDEVIAISVNAHTAYSGIEAFGPPLIELDEAGTTIQLNPEGFIAWTLWLKKAQENPNIILSDDEVTLAELFRQGKVAAYLGPYENPAALLPGREDKSFELSINSVPKNESNISRPLIRSDLIYFNNASSERQQQIALNFSDFLTNSEQGSSLLRELNFVPANQRVQVNRRVYPIAYAYAQSSRTAVAIPIKLEEVLVGTPGNTAYTAILSGAKDPDEAFCDWQAQIEAAWDGTFIGADFCDQQEDS